MKFFIYKIHIIWGFGEQERQMLQLFETTLEINGVLRTELGGRSDKELVMQN